MDPRKLFADERLRGACTYCGAHPDSRDHVPSKVFLDEPYPADLPVVESCEDCNNGFSLDEQYVACLLECVVSGSADAERVGRPKIRRILRENPRLAQQIATSQTIDGSSALHCNSNEDRVRRVLLKLAQGHASFELSIPILGVPDHISWAPLVTFSGLQKESFLSVPRSALWPEVGSRAFIRAALQDRDTSAGGWEAVQEGRYQYFVRQHRGITVKSVICGFLACEVVWQ
jgi:hypothetical protein